MLASESGGLISKVDSNWLSEASRLLPQLRDLKSEVAPPTPLDTPGARIRFFEAVGQIMQDTLAGAVPGVLFIDDLQWADDASIELLSYLVRRLRSRSILVLLAIRPDVVASRSLQILLADAQRSDVATIVEIGRLVSRRRSSSLVRSPAMPAGFPRDSRNGCTGRPRVFRSSSSNIFLPPSQAQRTRGSVGRCR